MCSLDALICSCGLRVAPGAGAVCSPCIWRTCCVGIVPFRSAVVDFSGPNFVRVGPRVLSEHTVLFMRVACHPGAGTVLALPLKVTVSIGVKLALHLA